MRTEGPEATTKNVARAEDSSAGRVEGSAETKMQITVGNAGDTPGSWGAQPCHFAAYLTAVPNRVRPGPAPSQLLDFYVKNVEM